MSLSASAAEFNYENILVEDSGSITWIILNRPDRANALSKGMLDEISDALIRLRTAGKSVLGIRGAGAGFCSGYDLNQVGKAGVGTIDPIEDRERLQRNLGRWLEIWDHPKPIIAAVHGYCIAGGTQICVFSDITVVADDAKIGEPIIPIGGGYIAPTWMPLVGSKRAKELAFVPGNSIDGPTAVAWGWANHSVPADELVEAVESLAARIATIPSDVLRIKKLSINRTAESMGFRNAVSHIPEMDALLHMAPSVIALKQRVKELGFKTAAEPYRVARTTPLRADKNLKIKISKE